MKPVVGVIGLGIMGGAMAEALLARGYRVTGYDIAPAARRRLKKAGGRPLASSTTVARSAEVVITSLATVAALEDVIHQIATANRPKGRGNLIVIETSTLPLADKELALRRLKRAGVETLDCPISGTAESLTFGRKMGLEPQLLLDLFGPNPIVGTGVYRLRGAMMARRRYVPPTMKVEVWQKDMQVIGDMAKSVDCPTPLFTACVPIYSAAMAQGLAQSDTASVHEVLALMAGVRRPRRKA